ncbi:DUF3365 domain-containing protein [Pseudomonas sp. NPDC047963]
MRYLLPLSCLALSLSAQAEPLDPLVKEGMALIPPFQQQLMATVKSAVKSGGPQQAVQACQQLAPQITAEHSEAPWRVGRTALKLRNQDNAPDPWERAVLEQFQRRAAEGEPLQSMSHAEVVDGEFRLMKAIPTGEACLACHGGSIKPELTALIDQYYPDDEALDFKLGELRGAFTLRRAVD